MSQEATEAIDGIFVTVIVRWNDRQASFRYGSGKRKRFPDMHWAEIRISPGQTFFAVAFWIRGKTEDKG